MNKPNIQLLLISKDVQERQTLNPNLHLVGWVGDNCNVCGTLLCSVSKDAHERKTFEAKLHCGGGRDKEKMTKR